jgi:hypothetical protein
MTKRFKPTLLLLMLCSCAAQERPVADPSSIPAFPPPPVSMGPVTAKPMLPWLKCLQEKGSNSSDCRSLEPSLSESKTTTSLPK